VGIAPEIYIKFEVVMRKKLFSLFIALTLLVTARPSLFSMNPKRRKTEKKIRLCSDVTGKIGEFCPRAEEFFAMRRVNHVWKKRGAISQLWNSQNSNLE